MHARNAEQQRRSRVRVIAERLYRDHYRYLLRIALRNAASPEDAEEAVNEAFASFIRAFDPDSSAPPIAWLVLTMKRECWSKRKTARLFNAPGETANGEALDSVAMIPSDAPGTEETLERAEQIAEGRRRLSALKPDQRAALGLFAAGFTYREIADRRAWTYTKVNRCLSEGRATLQANETRQ